MTFTHALSTNNYGPAKFIVSSSAANGTHTTLALAMAAASAGDTIEIRDATLTENVTITPGVNITGFGMNGDTPNVTINGTLTMTGAGTSTITGIRLQTNSANAIVVSGSAASILNLNNCYLNCSNTTGISFTSSSASAMIRLHACRGNIGTTGIAIHSSSSAGTIEYNYCKITNTGGSTTASSHSAGSLSMISCYMFSPFASTSTGLSVIYNSQIDCQTLNATAFAFGGTTANISFCYLSSGTATTITVAGSVTLNDCVLFSSNTNAISGAGTIFFNGVSFNSTGTGNTVTTKSPLFKDLTLYRASQQPIVSAYRSTNQANVTGDNTAATVIYDTELLDVTNSFNNTTGVFTAPYTSNYLICGNVGVTGVAAQTLYWVNIVTTARTYIQLVGNPANMKDAFTNVAGSFSMILPLTATNTLSIQAQVGTAAKTTSIVGSASPSTWLGIYMLN